ncbi:MAG: M23 family metallopeptidase [Nitrospirae bacterium]|nr:M23 family metallopeptidase [Nitrospirota bacterium]
MPLQKAGKRSQETSASSVEPSGDFGELSRAVRSQEIFCLLSSFLLIFFSYIPPLLADKGEQPPIKAAQGEAFIFKLAPGQDTTAIKGSLLGREVPFFKLEEGLYGALIGIDMEDEAGIHQLRVEISKRDGQSLSNIYPIKVIPGKFKIEDLTMPKDMVDLDDESLKRVAIEKTKTIEILSKITAERFWKGAFIMPAEGRLIENFGYRRRLNGEARSPHNGIDISAPTGTEIHAGNDGTVVLADDLFFGGKSIYIDHGLGAYTFYSHLSQINVSLGDKVRRGDLIGLVGSSGRATGPHLHWGMKINGARINPISVTRALKE